MVVETLKTVREAEANADMLLKNAKATCETILHEAGQAAAEQQRIVIERERQAAQIALEKAKEEAAKAMESARAAVSEETKRIKEAALSKETEAIQAVIDGLY